MFEDAFFWFLLAFLSGDKQFWRWKAFSVKEVTFFLMFLGAPRAALSSLARAPGSTLWPVRGGLYSGPLLGVFFFLSCSSSCFFIRLLVLVL